MSTTDNHNTTIYTFKFILKTLEYPSGALFHITLENGIKHVNWNKNYEPFKLVLRSKVP